MILSHTLHASTQPLVTDHITLESWFSILLKEDHSGQLATKQREVLRDAGGRSGARRSLPSYGSLGMSLHFLSVIF